MAPGHLEHFMFTVAIEGGLFDARWIGLSLFVHYFLAVVCDAELFTCLYTSLTQG